MSYGPKHVQWLCAQFKSRVRPHRFLCLSDVDVPGVETIPLRDNLPGWWSKIEVFREFTEACYVDLDTVVIGDVGRYIDAEHQFTASAGIYIRGEGEINSSLMCWSGDYRWLYERFITEKARFMAEYVTTAKWGDQAFIRDAMAGRKIDTFQSRFQGSVISYTRDVLKRPRTIRAYREDRVLLYSDWMQTPRFVFFNGMRKPWNTTASWIPPLQ